ncbi:hypothetical protein H4R99_005231 [Coemansia sp. RSA 1722]|nr:hypothetical protein H4R99_005231 [Coemansia sp. RSA 1722]
MEEEDAKNYILDTYKPGSNAIVVYVVSEEELTEFVSRDQALVFYSNKENDPGYRYVKAALKPIVAYCDKNGRKYYRMLDIDCYEFLQKYCKPDEKDKLGYGVMFFKKDKRLLKMEGFDVKEFGKKCELFDGMDADGEREPGCCAGCVIM